MFRKKRFLDYAVLFEKNNARIIKGINPKEYKDIKNCLINPTFPPGIAPHHWKMGDGVIEILSDSEKSKRDEFHSQFKAEFKDNKVKVVRFSFGVKHYLTIIILSSLISYCFRFLL